MSFRDEAVQDGFSEWRWRVGERATQHSCESAAATPGSRSSRSPARAKSSRSLTIAAVDIQRPWFLARCDLVRQSVRRACSRRR